MDSHYLNNNLLDLVYSSQVNDSGGTQVAYRYSTFDESTHLQSGGVMEQHDANPPAGTYRGNETDVFQWVNSYGSYLVTGKFFNDTGTVFKVVDPIGNATNYTYNPGSPDFGENLTQVSNALNQQTNYTYDYDTGLLASMTDANNQPTHYYYDSLFRLSEVDHPDGGQTTLTYNETSFPFSVTKTEKVSTSPPLYKMDQTTVDGLGRVTHTVLTSDPEGADTVDTTYDGDGRKATESNPYRTTGDATYGITTYNYDALGRVNSVVEPDGASSTVTTAYSGACTTVTDEAGKARKSCTDGLGRIAQVFEDPATKNYETDYVYDALGNLTSVTQKGSNATNARTRSFVYDSLSRLLTATNPESGTVNYRYTTTPGALCSGDPSALCRKVAPRPNQTGAGTTTTTYTYDALNRVYSKSYDDGTPDVAYRYDTSPQWGVTVENPVGRLVLNSTSNGTIGDIFSYDTMGRPKKVWNVDWVGSLDIDNISSFTYNLDGSVTTMTYPSGRVLSFTPESGGSCNGGSCTSGRTVSVTDTTNNIPFVSNASYAPPGELLGMKNGTAANSSLYTVSNTYTSRLQPQYMSAATATQTVFSLGYNFHIGAGDNGNVWHISNYLDGTSGHPTIGSTDYTYDSLNRIATAQTTGTDCTVITNGLTNNWGESFTVDAWGNLITKTVSKCTAEPLVVSVNTNNQFVGACYDAAGNLLSGSNCPVLYTYDGENRLASTAGYTYTYDGAGRRAKKVSGATGTVYARGAGNEAVTETNLSGSIVNEYVFFNGKRLARLDSAGVHYYFSDMLGSSSMIGNQSGTVEEMEDFYPYGGSRHILNNAAQHYHFTGKERDGESNIDYFGARYYSSGYGRFMTPDWAAKPTAVPYAELGNPQSLNLYSYTKNNPTIFTDPNGHCDVDGEHHGGLWCFAHKLGIAQTQKEQGDEARVNLSAMRGLRINGKPASVWAKGASNQQLIAAQRQLVSRLAVRELSDLFKGSSAIPVAGVAWTLGTHKSEITWQNQMNNRGWTSDQITEAIEKGEQFPAPNDVNPGNAATRYVNPTTGRYVVMDNVTHEILQLGGDGFIPK
jgi:RHS repeat-associated protein